MDVSLRQQLETFIFDPDTVNHLIQEYHNLVKLNPSWRIGGFISLIKASQ
jgi:hypothetical protein